MPSQLELPPEIASKFQHQANLNQLRVELAGAVLGHLAAVDMSHAVAHAIQEATKFGDGQNPDGKPLSVRPRINPQQAAQMSVAYAESLMVALGIARSA